jgi:four helix bundle protein
MAKSILRDKSYAFAVRIIRLSQFLQNEKKEYVLSKQVLKSGTAIGALVREAEFGQSKADFINKMSIALKEANETEYWQCLLKDTDYINESQFESLNSNCLELIAMLVATIKTLKGKVKSEKLKVLKTSGLTID